MRSPTNGTLPTQAGGGGSLNSVTWICLNASA